MKKIFILFSFVIAGITLFAQAPDKMSYQAVIRNASNNLVTSSPVGMRISILQGSVSGPAAYIETQTPVTNINGLVSIEIGSGVVVSGTFTSIDWTLGPYFIKTETDPTGGTSYTITGTSQLLSVPYALYARNAGNIPTNVSAFTNDAGYLTAEVDGSTSNELQTISRTGLTVTLSNGGGSYTDSVNVYTAGTGVNITGNVISATSGANIGDVKHGYQSGDHNGWYLLDGRLLTLLPANAQTNAASVGITVNLPNAINRFLADIGAVGTTGGAATITIAQANLPSVNFTGSASSNGSHNHTVDPASVNTGSGGSHSHDITSTVSDLNNAASQGWPAGGHNGMRTTDRQELTIPLANDIIQMGGAHTHTVDVASTTSSTDGAHTHTVTVNSGGSGTAINITNPYLSVNTFIYLGQ
jgi:hypothetical protein